MHRKTRNQVALGIAASAALAVAQSSSAFLIKNMTTGEILFYDGFDGVMGSTSAGLDNSASYNPVAAIGNYVQMSEDAQVNVQVTSGSPPGASEGSNYLRLFRNEALPDGTVAGMLSNIQGDAHAGEVIHLETMVYIPSGSPNARFQLFLQAHPEPGFNAFETAEAWVRPDGNGHVAVVSQGFSVNDTGVPYTVDTWQKWSIDYAVNDSTFSLTVGNQTATGLPSFYPNSGVNGFTVFNGNNATGSVMFDGTVTPKWNSDFDGTWSTGSNWTLYTPNSLGAVANLTDAITANRQITVDSPVTVGVINFNNTHSYTVAGSQTITLNSGIRAQSGNHTISAPVALAGNTTIAVTGATSTLKLTGNVTANPATVLLTKTGAGTLEMNNIRIGQVSVDAGVLKVKAGATANSTTGSSLVSAVSATGALDLTNNALVVDYAPENGTPRPAIRSLLQSGYNSGAWNGNGIRSSSADASGTPKTAIAYAEAGDLEITTYAGLNFDSSAVVLRYALSGDANLDDKVNTLDFNLLAGGFGGSDQQWRNGDFNYDGNVDSTDFTLMVGNYGRTMPAAASLGAVVPEPCTLGLLAAGAAVMFRRRRNS